MFLLLLSIWHSGTSHRYIKCINSLYLPTIQERHCFTVFTLFVKTPAVSVCQTIVFELLLGRLNPRLDGRCHCYHGGPYFIAIFKYLWQMWYFKICLMGDLYLAKCLWCNAIVYWVVQYFQVFVIEGEYFGTIFLFVMGGQNMKKHVKIVSENSI